MEKLPPGSFKADAKGFDQNANKVCQDFCISVDISGLSNDEITPKYQSDHGFNGKTTIGVDVATSDMYSRVQA